MSIRRHLWALAAVAAVCGAIPAGASAGASPQITDIWPSGRRPSSLPAPQLVAGPVVTIGDLFAVCPPALHGGCETSASLAVTLPDGRHVKAGRSTITVAAGGRMHPRVRLNRRTEDLLERRGELMAKASVTVTSSGAGARARRDYPLRLVVPSGR